MPLRLLYLFLLSLVLVSTSRGDIPQYGNCSVPLSFHCGSVSLNISYPFLAEGRPNYCGHPGYHIVCSAGKPTLQFNNGGVYLVKEINYRDAVLSLAELDSTKGHACPGNPRNTSLNSSLFDFTSDDEDLWLFSCENLVPTTVSAGMRRLDCSSKEASPYWYYALEILEGLSTTMVGLCGPPIDVRLNRSAVEELEKGGGWGDAVYEGFGVGWKAGIRWCSDCVHSGGACGYNSTDPSSMTCFCRSGTRAGSCGSGSNGNSVKRKLLIAFGSLVGGFLLALVVFYLWYQRQKGSTRSVSRKSLVRSVSTDPSPLDRDLEALGGFYHTPIFTYEELQEATGNFDSSKELGDGGFGVVYKGFLKDGRVVAVKRLHECNYRRVQQFRNEVEILNRIRHPNLVSLYGCTTRDSRELLLVYEFVPNGTLADHLNGPLASENLLTWPRRLSIAVETAAALAYLHATQPQIIHRDVKTSNILLDNAFHVKVADFGLSRLFPSGMATHVTTAPQGTPGYVDPEYHQCYQLTDKSDVYSFGVVLVELISSKTAVDIDRPRSEINLSNIAMAKIPRGLVHELVDPMLRYDTDPGVKRTVDAVAELAFRCLQPEKDMRPSMDEVRDTLEHMDGGDQRKASTEGEYQTRDDTSLLKSSESAAFSPVTVIGNWASTSTTHSASP